jgi:hypothetical protein
MRKVDQALDIWKKLLSQKKDPIYIREASFAIRESSDQDSLPAQLRWIFDLSESAAIDVILSTKHKSEYVIKFLEDKKLMKEKIRYLDYITRQPNYSPIPPLINECFSTFISILASINAGGFDDSQIEFTDVMIWSQTADQTADPNAANEETIRPHGNRRKGVPTSPIPRSLGEPRSRRQMALPPPAFPLRPRCDEAAHARPSAGISLAASFQLAPRELNGGGHGLVRRGVNPLKVAHGFLMLQCEIIIFPQDSAFTFRMGSPIRSLKQP